MPQIMSQRIPVLRVGEKEVQIPQGWLPLGEHFAAPAEASHVP